MASDRAANDQIGISAAAYSNLAALTTVNSSYNRAVYVFARSASNWTEQARLVPPSVRPGHGYAKAAALWGETLAATAYADDTPTGNNAGSAYVLILDDDGDGLSDGFERNWGTRTDLADSDADGWSDYAEYLAGSNPTSPAATGFQLHGFARASDGSGMVLTWQGLADRLYDVQQTPVPGAAWGAAATNLPARESRWPTRTRTRPPPRACALWSAWRLDLRDQHAHTAQPPRCFSPAPPKGLAIQRRRTRMFAGLWGVFG